MVKEAHIILYYNSPLLGKVQEWSQLTGHRNNWLMVEKNGTFWHICYQSGDSVKDFMYVMDSLPVWELGSVPA